MPSERKKRVGVVYSTDPNFKYTHEDDAEQDTPDSSGQKLQVSFDGKRKGKGVTLVENFRGRDADRKALARDLKVFCGCGGSTEGETILIQGDKRQQVLSYLAEKGYGLKGRR